MDMYRVVVRKDKKHWCCIDIEHLNAGGVLADVAGRFSPEHGFDISVMKRIGEKRLLEASPAGMKVLAADPIFQDHP